MHHRAQLPNRCRRPARRPGSPFSIVGLAVFAALIFAALILLAQPPARASMVPALDLPALTSLADRVVVGEVLSVQSAWDRAHQHIFTRIEVQVAEIWKGERPPSGKIVISQPGGQVGDIEMRVFGLAEFHEGDRTVLFLQGSELGAATVGLGQGARPLRFDGTAQRWIVAGGDRTAAVIRDRDGRFGAAPPVAAESLESLRGRVRALVQR